MFGQKYGQRKDNIGKTSRREISSSESEPAGKGSKSGAPTKIGRYHMYENLQLLFKTLYLQKIATQSFLKNNWNIFTELSQQNLLTFTVVMILCTLLTHWGFIFKLTSI